MKLSIIEGDRLFASHTVAFGEIVSFIVIYHIITVVRETQMSRQHLFFCFLQSLSKVESSLWS